MRIAHSSFVTRHTYSASSLLHFRESQYLEMITMIKLLRIKTIYVDFIPNLGRQTSDLYDPEITL